MNDDRIITFDGESVITLNGAEKYVAAEDNCSYFVSKGAVRVFLVCEEQSFLEHIDGEAAQHRVGRVVLREVSAGKSIPSLMAMDGEHSHYFYIFDPVGDCTLIHRPGAITEPLRRWFAYSVGIGAQYQEEGFANAFIDYYQLHQLSSSVLVWKEVQGHGNEEFDPGKLIPGVIRGESSTAAKEGNKAYQALSFVCGKMRIPLMPMDALIPICGKDPELSEIADASNIVCRSIVLEPNWHRLDCGSIIGKIHGEYVACVRKWNGYLVYRTETGNTEKLTAKTAQTIEPKAYSIYRALPQKSLSRKDVLEFCKKSITAGDVCWLALMSLFCTLIGVLLPTLNQKIYDDYIPMGQMGQLTQMCMLIMSFMLGNMAFSIVKNLYGYRISSRMGYDFQNASFHRIFHLPESFFRKYDSADLAERLTGVSAIVNRFANGIVVTGMTTLFSLFYFFRMLKYSARLSWIALLMYGCYMLFSAVLTAASVPIEKRILHSSGEGRARLFQYLSGIDKIRMAGAEDRATYAYMQMFTKEQDGKVRQNRIISVVEALSGVISTVFTIVLYIVIVRKKESISIGSFMGFMSAFGTFTAAFQAFENECLAMYRTSSQIERIKPVYTECPERELELEAPGTLSGRISITDVSFGYQPDKQVLNGLSMEIYPGDYVGIVGASGCGKSTLLKLLLGFEKAQSGTVCFDEKNINGLNKSLLRKELGVVLQNGHLIAGSIYENITISAPHAKMADVNRVIRAVGLEEDIKQMPMGIHTMLSENCGTISGGQQQRILIARAIISNPSILIFDEATSALDNLTQAAVCHSLDQMNMTRIVVAHRLSTIRTCSKIYVLDGGKVVEEGNYESLMAKKGLFYRLASRQIVEGDA